MEFEFKIESKHCGKRLDSVLSELTATPSLSRSNISYLIRTNHIFVSGKIKKPGYRLKPGDVITGTVPEQQNRISISPEPIPIEVIHEDDHIIVVNKRAGMVVHPAPGNFTGTLVNALIYRVPEIKNIGEDLQRPGIVHRLDRDTTGVMVVAKNNCAFDFLKKEFKQRRVTKKYLCLVAGNIKENSGRIVMPVGRDRIRRKKMSVNAPHARHAETLWRIRKKFNIATFLEVELKTGRTHQIRVHFRAIGHPLMADSVYGFKRKKNRKDIFSMLEKTVSRQMLHSWKLGFIHPFSGKKLCFQAPMPSDMRQTLIRLSSV